MQQPADSVRGRLLDLDAVLSILRWIAVGVVFVLAWANPERPTEVAFLLAAYNAVLAIAMARSSALDDPWSLFLIDSGMVSLVLWLSGGLDSPAYIVYYLAIIALARNHSPRATVAASLGLGLAYTYVCLATTPGVWSIGRWETLTARVTVLVGVGLISSLLTQEARRQEEASRLERERAAQWQELERLRGVLLSTVSHEFKTPLAAIRTAADLLTAAPPSLSPTQARLVDNIGRNEQRLAGLVNDLLDAARLESGQLTLDPTMVSLADVLDEAASALRPLAEVRGQQIRLLAPGSLPRVWADRRRLGQIVGNLLSNALQFSPAGGLVSVEAWRVDGPDPAKVRISVTDNGPGIPAHEQALVFERFYSGALRGTGGTGLGLSIARSLAELHGGRVWVKSTVGQGSIFFLELPVGSSVPVEAE